MVIALVLAATGGLVYAFSSGNKPPAPAARGQRRTRCVRRAGRRGGAAAQSPSASAAASG